jgi:hypothetical protein
MDKNTQNAHIDIAYATFCAAQFSQAAPSCITRAIGAMLNVLPTAWRVVGMTPLAHRMLKGADKELPKGVTRAHVVSRTATLREVLIGPELSRDEFVETFLGKADQTLLCGPRENNERIARRDDIMWFENAGDDPLFQDRSLKARFGPAERSFIANF